MEMAFSFIGRQGSCREAGYLRERSAWSRRRSALVRQAVGAGGISCML